MQQTTGQKPHIAVLGAGVIGLQTALTLLKDGFDVTIISKDMPGDRDAHYTSMWSGAQWRSNPLMDDLRQQDWDRQTFLEWTELVKHETPEKCGVELKEAVFYWDAPTAEALSPAQHIWWTSFLPTYRPLAPSSLPAPFAAGITYRTFALNPALYLTHLLSACLALGARTHTAHLAALAAVHAIPACAAVRGVVNCAGLGARALVPDGAVYPVKGQTVIVRGRAARVATRAGDGWEGIVIPRPGRGETLLGGCKLADDWSTEPDPAMTARILERCAPIAPELLDAEGEFDVLAVQVGLRPMRRGGPRMEVEWVGEGEGRKFICHCYGHGSAGYEGSVGVARTAVDLVRGCLQECLKKRRK